MIVPRALRQLALVAALLSAGAPALAQDPFSPAGRWKTIDDKTGETKSIVEIAVVNGEAQGKVAQVFVPPAKEPNPKCVNCVGDLKDKPIIGMQIMWGLKRDGNEYTGGRVMDPDDGKTYRCKIRVVEGGKKLEVRGYIGMALFGRTQTWVRE